MTTHPTRLGPYTLDATIGEGLSTEIWRAHLDGPDQHPVIIKIYTSPPITGADEIARFEAEAEFLAGLSGPCLPRIFDHGVEGERAWVAVEEVGHRALQEVLSDSDQVPFDLQRALDIATQATFALWEQLPALSGPRAPGNLGHVLNPWHVRLDERDRVRLLGLTSPFRPFSSTSVGRQSPERPYSYLAPELIRGEAGDARTEIYAMGSMIHTMVVGEPPFGSEQTLVMTLLNILNASPPTLADLRPELPAALNDLVNTAMEKAAEARHPDLWRFLDALLRCPLDPQEGFPVTLSQSLDFARDHIYQGDIRPIARLLHDHPTAGDDPSLQDYLWDHLGEDLTAPWRGAAPMTWSLWRIASSTPQIGEALTPWLDADHTTHTHKLARLLLSGHSHNSARARLAALPPLVELAPPEEEREVVDGGLISRLRGWLGWQ